MNPTQKSSAKTSRFDAFEVSLQLVGSLIEVIGNIATRDAALAGQLRRAAASVPLNFSEGRRRAGKDRLYHYRVAAGSADEVVAILKVAEAWGYVSPDGIAGALALADRVLAMAWRLTH